MSGGEWNLTDELAHALAHALAHNHHAKGTCDQCDRGRAAVDEWLTQTNAKRQARIAARVARRNARVARRNGGRS